MLKVFVYGTLKPGESNYPQYCEGQVISVQKAYTLGCLYDLPFGYPAMISGNQRISGFLLIFTQESHLKELDELESYDPEHRDAFGYYREQVSVYSLNGDYLDEAWAYFMTAEQVKMCGGRLETSGCWH